MKKIIIKFVALAMAAMSVLGVACGGDSGGNTDKNKTSLRVFTYNGGVGRAWLDALEKRFEADYADVSFEPGKTGVDIEVDAGKNSSIDAMLNLNNDIVFCEVVNYPSLAVSKKTLDISDVLTTPLKDLCKTDDERTLEDKLYDEQKEFLKFSDGNYYAVPHYSYFSSLIYNKKLFDDKQLYFAATTKDNTLKGQFIQSDSDKRSCGPDGKYNTFDDGLPATWEEMFLLADWMIKKNVTPFIYAGESPAGYLKYLLNNVYLNLVGKDKARYNYTYDSGTDTITILDNVDTGATKQVTITNDNYKLLHSQVEKYQAVKVAEEILDRSGYLHSDASDSTVTMLRTQEDYIKSYNENEPVAMLIEGSYWYNEADDAGYFEDARDIFGSDFDERNEFCIMPLPRVYRGRANDVYGKEIHKTVVADQPDCFGVINANIKDDAVKAKLAKTFLAYAYTDESLAQFTEITRTVKCLKYDVDVSKLDKYTENVWDFYKNSDILLPYSGNTIFLNNMATWTMHIAYYFWNAPVGNVFNNVKGEKTAEEFFKSYMKK